MIVAADRETTGVLRVSKKGRIVVYCGRCAEAGGHSALAFFQKGDRFLLPDEENWGWRKEHGIYEARRSTSLSRKPAPGSRIRCRVCQWINTVPEPED